MAINLSSRGKHRFFSSFLSVLNSDLLTWKASVYGEEKDGKRERGGEKWRLFVTYFDGFVGIVR
jgi:hypothetical protein